MSEHLFFVSHDRPTRANAARIERIARDNGATWVETTLPGVGYQSWFACRNMGEPFDGATDRAVRAALAAAGITGADGRIIRAKRTA